MEYREIAGALGGRDMDGHEAALVVDAVFGPPTPKWLLEALEAVVEAYKTSDDVRLGARQIGRSGASLLVLDDLYMSGTVLRNVFRAAFETSAWDGALLTPEFLEGLGRLRKWAKDRARTETATGMRHYITTRLDASEAVEEFAERLAAKAQAASGM